ncbi:hypothetical protein KIM372_01960 [Bombiscardovia nodaiensis]|uniref:RCC1-like domain-containing protein n=1 Tax=Bombiscardovia nodaiensis TaxID=2932181 RepID=A0ABN6S827_9BIFI|nr:hypothetical protein KIM372_01960 [Bombiscardovia nodaiensis]
MAIGENGKTYAWGYAFGTSSSKNVVPALVQTDKVFTSISAAGYSQAAGNSLALLSDGTAYSWGSGGDALGRGTTLSPANLPGKVEMGVINVTGVTFDYNGKNLTRDSATQWHVSTPAHPGGTVDAKVLWTLNGKTMSPITFKYTFWASFVVSFDLNGAPGVTPPSQRILIGRKAQRPQPEPQWPGHVFDGWFTNQGSPWNFDTAVNETVQLTAKWDEIRFTIKPNSGPVQGNTKVDISADPALTGIHLAQVSAGSNHSLAIGSDNKAYAWGNNIFGKLGDNSVINRNSPVLIKTAPGVTFVKVIAGTNNSFAFASDGSLYGWGTNNSGQLGLGDKTNRLTPTLITPPAGATKYIQVSPGDTHTVAIADDGKTYAWGNNEHGQLGTGDTTERLTPTQVQLPSGVSAYTQVSAGNDYCVGLDRFGKAYSWGLNRYGQLGNTSVPTSYSSMSATPVPVQMPVAAFKQIGAKGSRSMGLSNDGHLYTWGRSGDGELGSNSNVDKNFPIAVNLNSSITFDQVFLGPYDAIAISSDHRVYAWGNNTNHQLSDSNDRYLWSPTLVDPVPGTTFTSFSAGEKHTLAIDTVGQLWAWGSNNLNQLGNGKGGNAGDEERTPVKIGVPPSIVITQVTFAGSSASSPVFDNATGTWNVQTPVHSPDQQVDVVISWKMNDSQQPDYTIHNGFLYYTLLNIPKAGTIPLHRLTGSTLLLLIGLAAVVYAGHGYNQKRKQGKGCHSAQILSEHSN